MGSTCLFVVVYVVAGGGDVFCFVSTTCACIKEPLYDKMNCEPSKD